jgi:hypothetical protein
MALSLPLPLRHSFTSIPSQPSSPHSPQLCHINPTFSSLTTLPFRNQPAYYDLPPYSHRFYSAVRFTFTLWTLTRAGQLRPLPAPAPVLHTRLRLLLSIFKPDFGSGSNSGSSSSSDSGSYFKTVSFSLVSISMGFLGFQGKTSVKKIIEMKRNE